MLVTFLTPEIIAVSSVMSVIPVTTLRGWGPYPTYRVARAPGGLQSRGDTGMKNRAGLWLAAVYLALATVALSQAPPDARQEIERLEEQARQAALKGDAGFVEKYTAPDYVAIMANGRSHSKAEEIQNRQSGGLTYQTIEVRELKVRIYGDTAVCNSLAAIKLTQQEKGYTTYYTKEYSGDYRITRVWVKQGGDWKLVSFQSTRASE